MEQRYFTIFPQGNRAYEAHNPRAGGWKLPEGLVRGNIRKQVQVDGWEYYNFLGLDRDGFFRYANKRKIK